MHLIGMIDCLPGEKILEVGFGTGATLALLASENRETEFYGAEASGKMFDIATSRLRFCGLENRIELRLMNSPTVLPFEGNYFDKIYFESMLAIQEDNKLHEMLSDIKRILKPDGILVMNETIWLESTSLQKIRDVNEFCKKEFGIIQANAKYPFLADWKKLFQQLNFEILEVMNLDEVAPESGKLQKRMLRSDLFTLIGKLKLRFKSKLRNESRLFQNKMNSLAAEQIQLMRGYLIKMKNSK